MCEPCTLICFAKKAVRLKCNINVCCVYDEVACVLCRNLISWEKRFERRAKILLDISEWIRKKIGDFTCCVDSWERWH